MSEVAEKTGRKSRAQWVELMAVYEAGDLAGCDLYIQVIRDVAEETGALLIEDE